MFDYITGILADKSFPNCTIENNGIGYSILTNSRTLNRLPELNSEVKIYLKLIHKEDNMFLCGFLSKQDRILFDILTSVSGVGVKVAFALLDEFETNDLIQAVLEENYKLISKTKGLGLKTAQKIVLEIKDKLTKINSTTPIAISKNNSLISDESISQAITVLESLGYSASEYNKAIETALSQVKKDNSEELLKEVLKILSIF